MPSVLHITNGDSSVATMRQAGINGEFLPWRDVLHEGPVPEQLSLKELSNVRAKFISDRGWGDYDKVLHGFTERDAKLASYAGFSEIVLWFEHDLYDQLQILQILDWFATQKLHDTALSIICMNQYLGLLTAEQMFDLQSYKQSVTQSMLSLASRAWNAFSSSSPDNWCALLETDLSALPFLHNAVVRLLEEFPASDTGLSRTALQALTTIANDPHTAHEVFKRNQAMEDAIFMGDSSFRIILCELIDCNPSLITVSDNAPLIFPQASKQLLNITDAGMKVLSGDIDFLSLTTIDRWIGGVRLQPHKVWRWDAKTQLLSSTKL